MSTFDSTKIPLREVIYGIKKGEYQLPDFQRGWVWDEEHVRSLLVSIARSFPIGAIMTLETGGDVHFKVRPVENVQLQNNAEPEKLILDGQQRLTSLTQVLGLKGSVKTFDHKKSEVERFYYIDIMRALETDDLDEAFYSVGKDKVVTENFGRDIILDVSTPEKEVEAFQFPCNELLDYDDWQDRCYEAGKFKEFKEFKNKVIKPFDHYNVPIIALNKQTSKEAVCLVFEKVNTGGVSLSVFELITASFAADGYNLREDWYGNADEQITGRLERLKADSLLNGIQPTDFIQAITLLQTYQQNLLAKKNGKTGSQVPGISCKRKTMLNLGLDEYKKWATELEKAFHHAAKFLKKEGFYASRDLPYRTQLVPLAAIMAHLKDRWLEPMIYDRLRKWYWCGVLGELYGSAIENRFANDLEDFLNWLSDEKKIPRTVFDASFHPSRLETLRTRNSAAYKGIHALLLKNGAKDFFWKAGVQEIYNMGESLDIHHLFPRKWCDENQIPRNVYDSVVNKTPISYKANRKIGGVGPLKYLSKIQKDEQVGLSDLQMDKILESHLIEPGLFRNNDFTEFIHQRSINLVDIIYRAMGKIESMPDDIALFGYGSEEAERKRLLKQLTVGDESSFIEFKSTMRWNIKANMVDKKMEEVVLKSIAAFSNCYGGILMIGIKDGGEVIGLDHDYKTFKDPNKDKFEIHLRNLLNENFGKDFVATQLKITFPVVHEKEFCHIDIKRGKIPKYVKISVDNGPKQEKFYVRSGNTSQEMNIDEASNYINGRFQ